MRTLERHATLTALAVSIAAPSSLLAAIYWGDEQGPSTTALLVGLLIALFLFTMLRLVLLPAAAGRPTKSKWLVALLTSASLVGLAGVEGLSGHAGIGPEILVSSVVASMALFVVIELTARTG